MMIFAKVVNFFYNVNMKSLYSLIAEMNSLPKGNVYEKKIKGIIYYYYQYSDNEKKITKYISKDEAKDLKKDIARRIELKKEINDQLKLTNRNIALSNAARSFTGSVMLEDVVVAEYKNGALVSINEDLAPLIIKRTKSLEKFLQTRVIDTSRTNARLLKKALNIKESDETLLSLCSYAASLTDNYWFKPYKSKLKYKDISFDNDVYFDIALKGIIMFYQKKHSPTPELTTGGSFEKGWKNINGQWWLYKSGSEKEYFSELFYSTLFEFMNLPTAHYEMDDKYIRSKNFVDKYNYEPLKSLMDDDEKYENVLSCLINIDRTIARQYLVLTYYDVILNNVDRHNENCGLLRDRKSGKIISLAPNFDNNLCLISRTDYLDTSNKEGLLKLYISFLKNNRIAIELLKEANLSNITNELLDRCLELIPIKVKQANNIKEFILNRQRYLKSIINAD